jgi:glycosyltransferase involved in cell wall biosynthesis
MLARPTHVGLNAQLLSLESTYRSAGISWYIYHLLEHLPASSDEFRYTAFTGERKWEPAHGMGAAWTRWPTRRPMVRIAWEQVLQPFALASRGVDLVHSLAYVLPAAWSGPSVVTILDLSFVLFPERFRPWNRYYLKLFTRLSARRADRVIAISENTSRDAMRLLGLDERKVQVIYCGVDAAFHPLDTRDIEAYRRAQGLPEQFILFVGTIEPRKNIAGVIDAYGYLSRQWRPSAGKMPDLVIAGARGWYYEEVYRKVEQLGLASHVHFTGYAPAEHLPLLYNAAEAFVYPSLYEGFGLPVLEAMACGAAVVTSNTSSLPEVIGDAGLTVDPHDSEQIGDAILQVLTDRELREHMRARAMERAASFTWARTAQETVAVYRQVLGQEVSAGCQ